MPTEFTRIIKNSLDEMNKLAAEVDAWLESQNLHPKTAFSVGLALEEILINTINYGYDDDLEHEIDFKLSAENGRVTMTIKDDGRHFDPLNAPEPDLDAPLEERDIGGLGIHLTKKMMDCIDYRRQGDINLLVMSVGEEDHA